MAIWERPSPPHQCEDSGRGLLPILLDLDVPWATKIVVIQELRDPPGQYSTFTFCPSTKMLILAKPSSRPGETPLCGSISNFLLSSYCSIFNALDLAFDRHCTSPTSCVETFPSSQCPLLDQLPFGIRCSLSLHCYAFTACRIPQDLEEPRRLNQYPEAKGGHPFGILKTS